MTEVYLRRLSRWQAEQQRNAVADVHVSAYRGSAGAGQHDHRSFLSRFEQHVQGAGFDMVVAEGGGLVACAYGFRVPRTGEWWSDFHGELPTDIEELTASGRTFLLTELMVLPAHRRLGIATRLVERLLIRLDTDLVVTAVARDPHGDGDGGRPTNAAEETLRAWGWSRLGVLGPRTVSDVSAGSGSSAGAGAGAGSSAGDVWIRRPLH
ncbi:GNAT family N-acetyltransferase [Streptomyces sp. NPDC050704]|uniref:GNAT family N-acetyltransferase n=1 Tax=Streptomyces sp. NPDC050704 TaxID=3157219 RepID=UPI00343A1407